MSVLGDWFFQTGIENIFKIEKKNIWVSIRYFWGRNFFILGGPDEWAR